MKITQVLQFAGLGLWLAALASPHWLVAVPRCPYEHGHDVDGGDHDDADGGDHDDVDGGDHDGGDDLIEYDNLDAQAHVGREFNNSSSFSIALPSRGLQDD